MQMIPPNETILCELELLSVIPSISRSYKSVGLNESIKDELLEKIQSGESVISSEVVSVGPGPVNGTKTKQDVKMFDQATMKLDPNQRVSGQARDHVWEETPRSIEIEVAIPTGTTKGDLLVDFEPTQIRVGLLGGRILLEGTLHGKIVPAESMWALAPHDPRARIKGEKVVLSLEKSYGHREIWATVFDRDFLKSKNPSD